MGRREPAWSLTRSPPRREASLSVRGARLTGEDAGFLPRRGLSAMQSSARANKEILERAHRQDRSDQRKLDHQHVTERTLLEFRALEFLPAQAAQEQIGDACSAENSEAAPSHPAESPSRPANQRRRNAAKFRTANGGHEHNDEKSHSPDPDYGRQEVKKNRTEIKPVHSGEH